MVQLVFSGLRQLIAVAMILFGSLLAGNLSMGPCAGTILATEPFPAIFICVLGLELILCSYFVVRKLKVEADFRVIIYLFLTGWSVTVFSAIDLVHSGAPPAQGELSDLYFSVMRGVAAVMNLIVFYRWAGVKNMITRVW
jgi:hypothetical protein